MSPRSPLRAEGLAELYGRLMRALDDVGPVPCTGRDEWISADPAVRHVAANACAGCPVMRVCGAYAVIAGVTAGVWAGRDRQSTGRPRGRPRKIAA